MIYTIADRLRDHLEDPQRTLDMYLLEDHEDWEERDPETDELIGFVSYFYFPDNSYDMIVTAAKDDRFSRQQWKVISKTLKNRNRAILIYSDPTNSILHKGCKKYGGHFIEDKIFFPYPWEEIK